MLRAELVKQLLRARSAVALAILALCPVVAGIATASDAGGRNGDQGGLFGAAPFSALNHVAASLEFIAPLLLPVVVALFGSAFGAADRDWGTLRYLYVQPVSRLRLITGKWFALLLCCIAATACIVIGGLIIGLLIFGWHDFHRIGEENISAGAAVVRTLVAAAYVSVCMLGIGSIAFALGLVLPGAAEALGASVAFIVICSILNGQGSLHTLVILLPVHYWQRWQGLLDGTPAGSLITGVAVQFAAIAIVVTVAYAVLSRRDPAA